MKKHIWKILNLILILYFGFGLFKYYHPTFYGTSFNNKRIEIGLVPIDSSLVIIGENTRTFQIWKNKSDDVPRFYAKYVSFDKWNNGIEMETDTYFVLIDSLKRIVSINYKFETRKFKYTLQEYIKPKNTYDLYGHSGKTIKTLDRTETKEILNKNGIKY